MNIVLSMVLSYLIGSLPTAYLFGKILKGIDIREHGSGNVGATNAFRILGKTPGICVLLIDVFKGVVALMLAENFFHFESVWAYILIGFTVVAGHNWTIFLSFKGGKGIATSLGVLIGLTLIFSSLGPVLFGAIFSWCIVFLLTGYVSLSSIIAAIVLPLMMFITKQPIELLSLGLIFCFFIILRHKANIQRLLSGTESRVKFSFKK